MVWSVCGGVPTELIVKFKAKLLTLVGLVSGVFTVIPWSEYKLLLKRSPSNSTFSREI